LLQCTIEGISHRGEGVARPDGVVTFIPNAIPGEKVSLDIIEKSRRFQRARLIEVLEPSPHRVEPPCPYYFACGGCSYQHITYAAELDFKRQVVSDNLKHIGGINGEVNPVKGMPSPWRYRNKVTLHLQNIRGENSLGYYHPQSHRPIAIDRCLLISPAMENVLQELRVVLKKVEALQGQVIIRQDALNNLLVLIQTRYLNRESQIQISNSISAANLLWQDEKVKLHTIKGNPWLEERIGELKYRLSPLAFFQVNRRQCQVLYDEVKTMAHLAPSMRVLDAYCGTGTISLYLAREADSVLGVEAFAPAVEDARINAGLNNINNCRFQAAPCEVLLPQLDQNFDLVVIDPPRAGCMPQVLDALIHKAPPSLIYVSCNPATLARDLKILTANGYNISSVQPIDMFPRTHHVETVVLMSRVKD